VRHTGLSGRWEKQLAYDTPYLVPVAADAEELRSPAEFSAAYKALSIGERTNLNSCARTRSRGTRWDYRELLQEAFLRILSGDRRWPAAIDLVFFVDQVMRSIVSRVPAIWKRETPISRMTNNGETILGLLDPESQEPTAEQLLIVRQMYEHAIELLDDDPLARSIVVGWQQGLTRDDIKEKLEIADRTYDDKCKKIKRRLSRYQQLWL
jgi:hypothetical protein